MPADGLVTFTPSAVYFYSTVSCVTIPRQGFKCAWCGNGRQGLAALKLFKYHFDCLVELLVDTHLLLYGVVVDENVGVDTVILHNPLAVLAS